MRKRIGRWKIRSSARRTSKPRPTHHRQERGGLLKGLKSSSTRAVMYFHEGKGQPLETACSRKRGTVGKIAAVPCAPPARGRAGSIKKLRPARDRKAYPA